VRPGRLRFVDLPVCVAIAVSLTQASSVFATEPCLRSPCEDSSGSLVRSKCFEAAAWVAVGTISKVVHHAEGPPLSKDFAEFTFTARRWEKGKGKAGQTYRFRVGWCENQQELPKDTTVLFRVFGTSPGAQGEPRYLFLEPLAFSKPVVAPKASKSS
jgi:hypothetical protein